MVASIRIETAQVLELAGITSDKLRYWKDALPPIKGRDGRKHGYSFSEAVAIAAIAAAMRSFGIEISRFSDSAVALFGRVEDLVSDPAGPVVLELPTELQPSGARDAGIADVVLRFHIGRIADRLRERLTSAEVPQLSLFETKAAAALEVTRPATVTAKP